MKPGLTTSIGAASAVACTASLLIVGIVPANAQAAVAVKAAGGVGTDSASARLVTVDAVVTNLKDSGYGSLRAAIDAVLGSHHRVVKVVDGFAMTAGMQLKGFTERRRVIPWRVQRLRKFDDRSRPDAGLLAKLLGAGRGNVSMVRRRRGGLGAH